MTEDEMLAALQAKGYSVTKETCQHDRGHQECINGIQEVWCDVCGKSLSRRFISGNQMGTTPSRFPSQ